MVDYSTLYALPLYPYNMILQNMSSCMPHIIESLDCLPVTYNINDAWFTTQVMNTKDEIIEAMDGSNKKAPPAIFTQTGTVGQMNTCGYFWPMANFNPTQMAGLSLQASSMFGFQTARVPFSIMVEPMGFGCSINPGTGDIPPYLISSPFKNNIDFLDAPSEFISVNDFVSSTSICTVVSAAELISKREDLFLVSGMSSPFTVINNILGMENTLVALYMDTNRVTKWLSKITPHLCEYSKILSEISDDVMIIEESDSEILPPEYFGTIIKNYTPRIISSAKKAFTTIHSCGNTVKVAKMLASLGEDSLSPEASSDLLQYKKIIGERVKLIGCVNPVKTLMMGTPNDVIVQAHLQADVGFDIITPECGVPPNTSNDNLLALSNYRNIKS